jgi:hypothetical protein
MALDYVEHVFGPGETIQAIIRKNNHMAMTSKMLQILTNRYNELNDNNLPHPGDRVKIPLFVGFIAMPQTEKSYTND